jgi:hypothetical protein
MGSGSESEGGRRYLTREDYIAAIGLLPDWRRWITECAVSPIRRQWSNSINGIRRQGSRHFYALSLIATAPPSDKTYQTRRRQPERIQVAMPDRPA